MARKKSPRTRRPATRDRGVPPATPSPINKATGKPGMAVPSRAGAAATPPSKHAFPIVGIGASAGGLEAFSELLSNLPVEPTMAFVLIQHLDPKHPSILSDILSRTTRMSVVEAKHGMRVEPGHVYVMPPKAIAQELTRIGCHPYLGQTRAAPSPEAPASGPDAFDEILRKLREKSGIDFMLYRQTTIRRRIARRMMIHGLDTLEGYLGYLEAHPSQVHALYNDLLVNVTRVFRDLDAVRLLQRSVFPRILKQRPADAPIRVWAPGCSTGAEAYSLAIVWLESLGEPDGIVPIQLFGSDVSETAVVKARAGIYPDNIELDLAGARLRRFFVKVDGQHQVRKAVRELCVFARHNLATDPPFSKMDLIVCRNVLIYLEPELQKRVLSIFHYALKDPGFLMLGVAETVGPLADFFSVVDKKYRVYAKKPTSRRFDLGLTSLEQRLEKIGIGRTARRTGEAGGGPSDLLQEVDRILLSKYAPAGVLVNEATEILQFRGHTSP